MKTIPYPENEVAKFAIDGETPRLTQAHDVRVILGLIEQTTGNIVEIGCNRGLTTRDIAEAFPGRIVYALDYCLPDGEMHEAQAGERPGVEWFCDFARDLGNVVCIHAKAPNYDALVDPGVIFVDGDHSYEGCLRDSLAAIKYLQERQGGGIVIWHDVYDGAPEWVGVQKAIREIEARGVLGEDFEAIRVEESWVAYAMIPGAAAEPPNAQRSTLDAERSSEEVSGRKRRTSNAERSTPK